MSIPTLARRAVGRKVIGPPRDGEGYYSLSYMRKLAAVDDAAIAAWAWAHTDAEVLELRNVGPACLQWLRSLPRPEEVSTHPYLDKEEQQAMGALNALHAAILGWGPLGNQAELSAAIHVIQGFIIQHMLQRLDPGAFGRWYERPV